MPLSQTFQVYLAAGAHIIHTLLLQAVTIRSCNQLVPCCCQGFASAFPRLHDASVVAWHQLGSYNSCDPSVTIRMTASGAIHLVTALLHWHLLAPASLVLFAPAACLPACSRHSTVWLHITCKQVAQLRKRTLLQKHLPFTSALFQHNEQGASSHGHMAPTWLRYGMITPRFKTLQDMKQLCAVRHCLRVLQTQARASACSLIKDRKCK